MRPLSTVLLTLACLACGTARADDPAPTTSSLEGIVSREGRPVAAEVVALRLRDLDPTDELSIVQGLPAEVWRVPPLWMGCAPLLPLARSPSAPALRTRTGDDGRYRFDGLAPGTYFLRAAPASGPHATETVDVHAGGLRLKEHLPVGRALPATLRGRLRHVDGRPFRGRVALFHLSMGLWAFPGSVETDAHGAFELPLYAEAPLVGSLRVGAVVPERFAVLWPLADASAFFERAIAPGTSRASGRVLDAVSGQPIAGATVWAASSLDEGVARFERTTSDAQGRYRLPRLDAAPTHVIVTATGHGFALLEALQDSASDVRLPSASRLRGRLVPPPGVAVPAGLYAAAWHHSDTLTFPGMAWISPDADGRFELGEFGPGLAAVYAFGGGWIAAGVTEYVLERETSLWTRHLDGGDAHDVEVRLERAASVRGRVLGPGGQPAAGVEVRAWIDHSAGAQIGGRPPGTEGNGGAVGSSADGSFLISRLIPGLPYRVHARGIDDLGAEARLPATASGETATVELRLAPPKPPDAEGGG